MKERVILVADDDALIRGMIRKALHDKCRIVEVAEAKDVLDAYKKTKPVAIFLDIHFPGGNGFDLAPQIKDYDKDAYLVMLTSDSTEANVVKAINNDASGFIAKPFTKQALIDSLKRCPVFQEDEKSLAGSIETFSSNC